MSSSSRSSTQRNGHHHHPPGSSPLVNGSSTKMMIDHHHRSAGHRQEAARYIPEECPVYHNDPSILFHRGASSSSSRAKSSTLSTSSSASSSPSLSLARDHGRGKAEQHQQPGRDQQPSRGNLVKQMVDNLYINAKSPVPNLVNSSSRSSFRGGGGSGGGGGPPNGSQQHPMSPSTAQRSFLSNLKSQISEPPSGHHQPNYDNLSPTSYGPPKVSRGSMSTQQVDSPSLDRKSITRASLPVGSSHPYYHRSGSGLSTASSSTASGQVYGQINQAKGPKYLDGDLLEHQEHHQTSPSHVPTTWVEILEPRSRQKMFANLNTGECRWEEPKGVPILRANNPNITQWWELYDQRTGRFYYYSSRDFKTIWQKPTSPDAVVVPLAKLQILKQNTNHHHHHGNHLNESFDSGTGGGGGSSSGHVTPSSPSLSSPSHPFGSRLKAWSAANGGPFGPIASPVAPATVDACTQTQNPITTKPTMVSRWTQTTNLTPTHVRMPPTQQQQQHQQQQRRVSAPNGPQNGGPSKAQPSLHHYLMSEKRFAKGRYSGVPPGAQEGIYDPVYDSASHGLIYGNASDFYDIVAGDPAVPNQMALARGTAPGGGGGGDYYEDVYDDEYYDEDDYYEDDEFEDESEDDGSCDADDEFGGEGESLDSEDDDDEDEEDEECDFDESEEEDLVDGQRMSHFKRHQQGGPPPPDVILQHQPGEANDLELYSAGGDFGEFVRGHSHRQPLQVATRASVKMSGTSAKVPQQHLNEAKVASTQAEGLRMSASFSAVDFKRNAVGRSSYTPSLHPYQQQQQQASQQSSNQQPHVPPTSTIITAQSYSNPFNSGSLRSSTGRIGTQATTVAASQTAAATAAQRTSGPSNIAERIQLFNQKSGPTSGSVQTNQHQSSPTPVIIHRTPSSPPGVTSQQQTSTPLSARHSSGATDTSGNLQRYFDRSPQGIQSGGPFGQQQQQQQPSKSHSLSQIAPAQSSTSPQSATSSNGTNVTNKLSSNLANLNVKSTDNYYAIPPSSSSEALSGGSGTPQITKRNFPLTKVNSASPNPSYESSLEQSRSTPRTLNNTLGHSLSVSGDRGTNGTPSGGTLASSPSGPIQISNSTSAINRTSGGSTSFLGSFNDSHMVMLNKSQSVMVGSAPGHKKPKDPKEPKTKGTKGTKKPKENKAPTSGSSPKKKKAPKDPNGPPNTSIESFAKECVARHRKGGIFSKKKTLKSMLTHTKKPLKKPMISTISDSTLVKESVGCFKMIQIYMRDRVPSPALGGGAHPDEDTTIGSLSDEQLLVRLISICVQLVPLRDEVLVQVARQVTQNPSPESEQRGLELMCVLFWYFTASNKLASHLHAFLAGHRNLFTTVVRRKFEQQMYRARHTHSVLFFRKPHSPEEVSRVLRCVRAKHVGLFGETLADGIVVTGAGENDPKKQLPWPIVLLTEALLEPRHEDREGVFRCVGDMDDVHKLKMKIDTTLPSDPYFSELIGRSGKTAIGKLSDVHDLHVISSTLKLYFRELRESVIPAELYLEALDCAHSPARACGLLDKLPLVNRATLCYLIRFLQVFSAPDHVRDTKMDDANLSMVWAPNILRSLTPNALPCSGPKALLALASANSANIYEQTRAEMSLVRTLIQHLDTTNAMVQ